MKALIVGYGSIGARHARVLSGLGCNVSVVSRRLINHPSAYNKLEEALLEDCPDYIVISNSTNEHFNTLNLIAETGFSGNVLIEKPLFDYYQAIPKNNFTSISVAYNLRFHPVINRLREILTNQTVLSVNAYVGQYLPGWRPDVDYRKTYSAHAKRGGGALRDLSHELDYLSWIFGNWNLVTALGGHISPLEIDSDDLFVLLMCSDRCPVVSVQISYLDREVRRHIIVNTEHQTIEADLITGTIKVEGEVTTFPIESDQTYRDMHQAVIEGNIATLCTAEEGLATIQLIETAERANKFKEWISR